MTPREYPGLDGVGAARLATLPDTGLDFSYGLLMAIERSLWGELEVRYLTVEDDTGRLLAFTPVYVGSNLNFNALLPRVVQDGYNALVSGLGSWIATRVAVVGCLISDRGWVPMAAGLSGAERRAALGHLLVAIERVAKELRAQLVMLKDIHRDFPAEERAVMRQAGFQEGYSLPTIRVDTAVPSFEAYLEERLTKNGRKHARKQFRKAEGLYQLRAVEDFAPWVETVFPLHRAVFLKAKYQFEELPPVFFEACAGSTQPRTELVLCETRAGKVVGSLLIFYDEREQLNKRIGIDYGIADSGLIYNLLNYTGIRRAIERGLGTVWLGQSTYLPKTRLGGKLEDQYLLLKAHDPLLKLSLPLQNRWMTRYSAANIEAGLEGGGSL